MTDIASGEFVAAGERWVFTGVLTFDDAMAVLDAAAAVPLPHSGVVDLAGMKDADSSALAVLLALRRRAAEEGHTPLSFVAVPPMLDSLARVYGIEDLIVA